MKKAKTIVVKNKKHTFRLIWLLILLVVSAGFAGWYHFKDNPSTTTTYIAPSVMEVVVKNLDDVEELKERTLKEKEELQKAAQKEEDALLRELNKLVNEDRRLDLEKEKIRNQQKDINDRLQEIRSMSFMREESSPERNSN